MPSVAKNISGGESGSNTRIPIEGDADFIGPIIKGSWKLTPNGQGAHLVEKSNIRGRNELSIYNKSYTPRFYPYGQPEGAGKAHIRLHEATRNEGIKLRGGNPGMSFEDLINSYHNAYNNPSLDGIRGDLRTPDSSIVVATNVTPGDAFKELLKWGNNN